MSDNSVETVLIAFHILTTEEDEYTPWPWSPLFTFRLITFLTSSSSLIWRGPKLFRVLVMVSTGFWLHFGFPLLTRDLSTWTQHSLVLGWLFSIPLFSCIIMVSASLRESFSCSYDKTRLSKVKHFSSSSLITLSFLETEDNNVSHRFL